MLVLALVDKPIKASIATALPDPADFSKPLPAIYQRPACFGSFAMAARKSMAGAFPVSAAGRSALTTLDWRRSYLRGFTRISTAVSFPLPANAPRQRTA